MNLKSGIAKDYYDFIKEMPYFGELSDMEKRIAFYIYKTEKGLNIKFDGNTADIGFNKDAELFRALCLFVEKAKKENSFEISENPAYDTMGIMLDCSRNAVVNVNTAKEYIRNMAVMGFNVLMLYTEDTYEIEGEPYFGYMRGRFTKEEIREIDAYAKNFGIELVPCIQTLAHLNQIFRWYAYTDINDIKDILLAEDPRTYELIDKMLKSVSEAFSSKRINVGMDEAALLGHGKYLDKHGFKPRGDLMKTHLAKVMEICQKYGFSPMMWSDMFFRNGDPDFKEVNGKLPQAGIDKIPEGVTVIHWDYMSEHENAVNSMLHLHKLSGRNVMFAGGAWKWFGFAPFLEYSFITSRVGLHCCSENGIKEVLMTAWGDGGGEGSTFLTLPVMQLYAEDCYENNTSDAHIKERLFASTGMILDDAMLLDLPHSLPGYHKRSGYELNPAVYLLYQDVLMGLFDKHVKVEEFTAHYREAVKKLKNAAERAGKWAYIYELMTALCDVLEIKCGLGVRLKKAYDENDRTTIGNIKDIDIPELSVKVEKLYNCCKDQWFKEYKPFGFEVQDARFGALIHRLKSAAARLEDYLTGKINKIEELEQERLYFDCRKEGAEHFYYDGTKADEDFIHTQTWRWTDTVSASVL